MAVLESSSCLIAFILVISGIVMLSPVCGARNLQEVVPLPPLPSSTHKFLEQCATKLQPGCGESLVGALFLDKPLSATCCQNLVTFGRPCYDEFIVVTLPYRKPADPAKVIATSDKVWNECGNGPSPQN